MSSESAKKAWVTRRKNIAARVARHNMAAVAAAQQNTVVTDKGAAARKAWETRRQDEAERLEALAILDALAEQRRQAEEDNQPDDDGDFYSEDDSEDDSE